MEPPTISALEDVFNNLIGSMIALGGILLFIFLVIGGVRYITSGGDPKAVDSAKKTISYAVGGLILLLLSYLILVLIENITGAKVTNFNITL